MQISSTQKAIRFRKGALLQQSAFVTLGVILACSTAQAQQQAAEVAGTQLEEIIVTSRKREEALQKVPVSVLAFSTANVKALNAVNLDDLQAAAPGLGFGVNVRLTLGQLGIRGATDFSQSPSYDARVGVYLDGVYVNRSFGDDQSLLGMERVEIIRGPQGSTFGNATAGAISLVTKKPGDKLEGEAEVGAGSFGYRKIGGRVSLPIVDDKFAAAVTVNTEKSDGYLYNIVRKEHYEGVDRFGARVQFRIRPSEDIDINLMYSDQQDHNSSPGTISRWTDTQWANLTTLFPTYKGLANPTTYQIANLNEQHDNGRSQFLIANVDWQVLDGAHLTSITAYQKLKLNEVQDFSGAPANARAQTLNQRSKMFSQELRLTSDQSRNFDYIVGLYFQTSDDGSDQAWYLGSDTAAMLLFRAGTPVANIPAAVQTSVFRAYNSVNVAHPVRTDDQRYSAFANLNYRPAEAWEVSAGVRYTSVQKHLLSFSANDPLAANPSTLASASWGNFVAAPDSRKDNNVSPKFSVTYRPATDISVYASYAQGFKAGGWNTGQITQSVFLTGLRFGIEKLHAYEIGVKSELFDRRVRLNVTGFLEKFPSFQVVQFAPGIAGGTAVPVQTNGAKVTSKGIEGELDVAIAKGLTVSAQATYTNARFTSFPNGIALGTSADGKTPAYSPDFKFHVGVNYETPVMSSVKAILGVEYSRQSHSFAAVANTPAQLIPARMSLDARIGIADMGDVWSLILYGKNLADRENKVYSQIGVYGDLWSFYAAPRSLILTARGTF